MVYHTCQMQYQTYETAKIKKFPAANYMQNHHYIYINKNSIQNNYNMNT